jgi:hypothetical protein
MGEQFPDGMILDRYLSLTFTVNTAYYQVGNILAEWDSSHLRARRALFDAQLVSDNLRVILVLRIQ